MHMLIYQEPPVYILKSIAVGARAGPMCNGGTRARSIPKPILFAIAGASRGQAVGPGPEAFELSAQVQVGRA